MIGKIILWTFFGIVSIFTIIIGYLILTDVYSPSQMIQLNLTKSPPNPNQPSYYDGPQFYDNMRYAKKNLTYRIEPNCEEQKIIRMQKAFTLLENVTERINFIQVSLGEDISISCSKHPQDINADYFVAGEGGATSIVNTSLFYIIEKGEVLLFYEKTNCDKPDVELHELLHALGFKHSENPESIMYNVSNCNQVLTTDIINEIIRLYSIDELPDLSFVNFTAEKHGLYLDFEVEVLNKGLAKSKNISLVLSKDTELVKSFNIGDLDYGSGKIFTAENIWLGINAGNLSIKLVADEQLDNQNKVINFAF